MKKVSFYSGEKLNYRVELLLPSFYSDGNHAFSFAVVEFSHIVRVDAIDSSTKIESVL